MHISDDIYLGPVQTQTNISGGPSPMELGFGPMARVYMWDVVPVAKNTTGLAAAQAVAGAANLTLAAGTGVTAATDATGTVRYVLDVARCVDVVSSSASDTTQTATISGYDQYGQAMSQVVTVNGTSRVATTKAFKSVYRIAISAVTVGNISAGTTDTIGLPCRLLSKDYVVGSNFNATAVALSAYTAAVTTDPATTTTGDVRGTIALPSAADSAKRLVAAIAMPSIAIGPSATRAGLLGVTQV